MHLSCDSLQQTVSVTLEDGNSNMAIAVVDVLHISQSQIYNKIIIYSYDINPITYVTIFFLILFMML